MLFNVFNKAVQSNPIGRIYGSTEAFALISAQEYFAGELELVLAASGESFFIQRNLMRPEAEFL